MAMILDEGSKKKKKKKNGPIGMAMDGKGHGVLMGQVMRHDPEETWKHQQQ